MGKLFLVLFLLLAFGCKAPTQVTKLKENSDSLFVHKSIEKKDSVYVFPASESTIEFELIVDSTGSVKPFKTALKSGQKQLKVSSAGNNKLVIQESSPEVLNLFQKQHSGDSTLKSSDSKTEKVSTQKTGSFQINWFLAGAALALIIIILIQFRK
ncbi:MAG: hypothetical protein LCH37_12980 [Bacteroidetes bacterium]|nr:hypothetical protein [Bacteroidota bacterium]